MNNRRAGGLTPFLDASSGGEGDVRNKEGREKSDEGIRLEQEARSGAFVVVAPWTVGPLDGMHRRGVRRAGEER